MAFVRFYIDAINMAWTKPDATILPPLAASECHSCANFQKATEGYVRMHHRMASTPLTIQDIAIDPGAPDGQMFVSGTVSQPVVEIIDVNGSVVDRTDSASGRYRFGLLWKEGRWLVFGIAKM